MKLFFLALIFAAANVFAATPNVSEPSVTAEKVNFEIFVDSSMKVGAPLHFLGLKEARPDIYDISVRYLWPIGVSFEDNTFWRTAYIAEFQPTRLSSWLQCVYADPETHTCASLLGIDMKDYRKKRSELRKRLDANYKLATKKNFSSERNLFINGELYMGPINYGQLLHVVNNILPEDKRLKGMSTYKTTKMYIVGSDKGLGQRDFALERSLYRWVPNLEVETLTPDSKKGAKLLKQAEAKAVPAYIFDKQSIKNVAVKKLLSAERLTKALKSDFTTFNMRSGITELRPGRKTLPKTLDLWVMSQCPYGVKAENALIKAIEENKLAEGVNVRLRFIQSAKDVNDRSTWEALHGEPEIEENLRQITIQKLWPDKLWSYLKIRNIKYETSEWKDAAIAAGIDTAELEAKVKTVGVNLMKKDIKEGLEIQTTASPTYFWQNTYVLENPETIETVLGYNPQDKTIK